MLELPIALSDLRQILRSHGVVAAYVFGSYARGEAGADSDLDILVRYGPETTLFDHLDLRADLEDQTRHSIDLVSERALSKHRAPYVHADKVSVL